MDLIEKLTKEYAAAIPESDVEFLTTAKMAKEAAKINFRNGFYKAIQLAANFAEEDCFQIGCTALEAEGIVRRTRDAIAEAIANLPDSEMD